MDGLQEAADRKGVMDAPLRPTNYNTQKTLPGSELSMPYATAQASRNQSELTLPHEQKLFPLIGHNPLLLPAYKSTSSWFPHGASLSLRLCWTPENPPQRSQ